ncbi:MAG: hypothetical protein M3O50_06775 [Myxococcota bacterium]|nr:hypothetical protein [Myxococcota bacterium]
MRRRDRFHRIASSLAAASVVALCATTGAAKDKRACIPAYNAYRSALERQASGHEREARALLQTCTESAQAACAGLSQKCEARYNQLGAEMPSVVPLVSDDSGVPLVDVTVAIDGEPLTSKLDGKGLPVDIGLHEFSFAAAGTVFATQRVLVAEGQRNRPLSVVMHSPQPAAAKPVAVTEKVDSPTMLRMASEAAASSTEASGKAAPDAPAPKKASADEGLVEAPPRKGPAPAVHRPSSFAYVFGGLGVAALGAGVLTTIWGRKDNDALAQCKPNCRQSSVDHVQTMYVVSDVSLGVGVAALAAATWLFLRRPSSTADEPKAGASTSFDVQPTRQGAVASVSGAF